MKNNTKDAFLALLKSGLWEENVCLSQYGEIDFNEILCLAGEQSIVGLIAAGLEHVVDIKIPKGDVLQFVGTALQLEQRNLAMNQFLTELIEDLRENGIYTLLVKGQGVAQCYERPLWRASGDIDLLLSESNLRRAKEVLAPMASSIEEEDPYEQHMGMIIKEWLVELHGNLRSRVSTKIDKGIDKLQKEIFYGGSVRSCMNGNTQVFLPSENIDVILIFTHILKHFFREGIGLRQICDWCRLLWVNREKINHNFLEEHLNKMGIMSEWKVFAKLAVDRLGMPKEAMPFYVSSNSLLRKAEKVLTIVFEQGNMGHNKDYSYQKEYAPVKRKLVTWGIMVKDSFRRFFVFPLNTMRSLMMFTKMGVVSFFGNK